jgi:hypothetical protein
VVVEIEERKNNNDYEDTIFLFINIYQGRVPSTVFQASYLKTNIREDRERILKAVYQLKEEIERYR